MTINKHLNALLLFYEKERKEARAYELEKRIIPNQERIIRDCIKLGLPEVADHRILEGMKREYKALTGREYRA